MIKLHPAGQYNQRPWTSGREDSSPISRRLDGMRQQNCGKWRFLMRQRDYSIVCGQPLLVAAP
jgi:hypothetical protein